VSNATPEPDEQVTATIAAVNVGDEPISVPPLCWQSISYSRTFETTEDAQAAVPTEEDPLALVREVGEATYGSVFTTREADRLGTEVPSVVACPTTEPQLLEPGGRAVGEGFLTVGRLGLEGEAIVRANVTYGDDSLPLDPYPSPEDYLGTVREQIATSPSAMPPTRSTTRSVTVAVPVTAPPVPPGLVTHRGALRIALGLPEVEAWARNLVREGRANDFPRYGLFRRSGGIWIVEFGYDRTGSGFKVEVDDTGAARVVDLRP
jgi:hypothetical protein